MTNQDTEKVLSRSEIDSLLPEVPDWRLVEIDGIDRLVRDFEFANFKEALAFVNRVGDLAELEEHHPNIHLTGYNKVTLETWSHSLGGLHRNDFVLAAKINRLV